MVLTFRVSKAGFQGNLFPQYVQWTYLGAQSLVDMGTDFFEDEPLLAFEGSVDLRSYIVGDACNLYLETFAYSRNLFRF